MPHRISELDKIVAELADLAHRATEINELQLASTLVGAAGQARESRERIARSLQQQADAAGKPTG